MLTVVLTFGADSACRKYSLLRSPQHELSDYKSMLSFNPATNRGTFATELVLNIHCNRSGLESTPKAIGMEIDMIGRASSVLDM